MNRIVRKTTFWNGNDSYRWEDLYGVKYFRTIVYKKHWFYGMVELFTYIKIEKQIQCLSTNSKRYIICRFEKLN